MYKIAVIPGDGIGPEVVREGLKVLKAVSELEGFKYQLKDYSFGSEHYLKTGELIPESVIDEFQEMDAIYLGAIGDPRVEVGLVERGVVGAIRWGRLDLYINLRPIKLYAEHLCPVKGKKPEDIDFIVVRENTEDLYAGIEFVRRTPEAVKLTSLMHEIARDKIRKDSSFSLKVASETGASRIVKFAFEYARANNRKKVTAVHKANILKASDGLFLDVAREVAKGYHDIQFEDVIIDTLCMRLVRRPEQFDILVLPNLYGDIVSELCAGLIGGLGLAPGANMGDDIAVFEPTHGSAPKYAGQDKVNPMAMMLSGVMMLRHLGEGKAADRLERAIAAVTAEGKNVTYDLKPDNSPPVGTSRVAEAVIEKLQNEEEAA